MTSQFSLHCAILCLLLLTSACAPAIFGGGVVGGYKVATDERSLGRQLDDGNISASIKIQLIDNPNIPAAQIDVDVVNGNAILTGVAPSRAVADKAIAIARGTEGVRLVTDNMQIGERTMEQVMNDSVTANKIHVKLLTEPNIQSLPIDIDVINGIVTISGTVDTQEHKARVIEIARTTPGFVGLIDNLTVRR